MDFIESSEAQVCERVDVDALALVLAASTTAPILAEPRHAMGEAGEQRRGGQRTM